MSQPDQRLDSCRASDKSASTVFRAAQIAACLGKSPQAIRKALAGIIPASVQIVAGAESAAWRFEQLPEEIQKQLQYEARNRRYRDPIAMLLTPSKTWEPPIPLEQICQSDIDQAEGLRRALLPWVTRQHDLNLSSAEIVEGGIADYMVAFGRRITGRYWRELFARTLQRDGGAENWGRLEIYLPGVPRCRVPQLHLAPAAAAEQFSDLCEYIQVCQQPPTKTEAEGIWARTLQEYDRLVSCGTAPKRAAKLLRDLLFAKAPSLAPSRDTLLKAFKRILARWHERGQDPEALADERRNNGGDDYEFPQSDLDLIEAKIVFHYGKYAPAWREAFARGELSEATMNRYRSRCRRKSYVPHKLITTLGQRPIFLYVLHRHRKDFNSMMAHFDTVYDGLYSLDCISADDVTLPVWFWYQPDPNKPATVTRGQCLVFIDLVSKRILGYSLQPDKNYNALVIYTETAKIFASKGVPRALLFERGIWQRAKIITGSAPHSIGEVTEGLRRHDVQFFHACSPQGKWEIEQVMGLIQNLMEGEAGYCGRDERRDRPDWIKKQLAEIQSSAGPHPSKHFYSFDQWNNRLAEIFEEYNTTRQGGRLMRERSPDEVYMALWNTEDPPTRLGPELRPLFARAKYETTVSAGGVTITSGNRKFKYFGPELQDLVGYRVIVWFDPEFPDVATVTDMDHKRPVAVPLHTGVPRLERLINPDGAVLEGACERRGGQVSAIVAHYNVLRDKFDLPYRKNLVAAQTLELGAEMARQTEAIRSHKTKVAARAANVQRKATRLGIDVLNPRLSDADEGMRLMLEAQGRQAEEPESPNPQQQTIDTEL